VRHSTTLEAGVHIEDYDDNLELNVPTDLQLTTPAFVAEHSWHPQVNWAILLGNRTEYYSKTDETVLTPRMALAWDATPMATFRLTAGTGYRPVTLFSLDASTMAGFENMILDDKLKPERSIALSLAANRRWTTQSHTTRIDVNVFYTDFSSKAIAKLGDGNSVLYANVNDAFSRGFELQTQWTDMNGWKGAAGFSRTQSRFLLHGDWMNTELQYSYTADGTLAKEWKQTGITTDVTGTVFGPQYLPEGRGRDKSPAYVIWNSSVRKQWDRFSATLGVNNIFDWTQSDNPYYFDPNTGRVNPDTALFYGPILGRTCLLSLGYTFGS
jgi:outer membrane receptor for ferrienterochelin and colicins